ncbi:hypothetical protein C8T65DRAFT_63967 [Cerioporus squamosus]|nr:hypothetical protein C8T65DRAFT_63967 [Cerioporus squamosus]
MRQRIQTEQDAWLRGKMARESAWETIASWYATGEVAAKAQTVLGNAAKDVGTWLTTQVGSAGETLQHAMPNARAAAEGIAVDAQKVAEGVVQDAGKWLSGAGKTLQQAAPDVSEARVAAEAIAADVQKVAGKAAADVGKW